MDNNEKISNQELLDMTSKFELMNSKAILISSGQPYLSILYPELIRSDESPIFIIDSLPNIDINIDEIIGKNSPCVVSSELLLTELKIEDIDKKRNNMRNDIRSYLNNGRKW